MLARTAFGLFIFSSLLAMSSGVSAGSYCEGFRAGYVDAYRSANGVRPPLPPCPPVPPRMAGAPDDPARRGYVHGVQTASEG